MRKVELLPTRNFKVGYGPDDNIEISLEQAFSTRRLERS